MYASNTNYKKAVAGHIAEILICKRWKVKTTEENSVVPKYFNRKYVKKTTHLFAINKIFLLNNKKRIKDIKNVGVRWIGPCMVVYERPGKLLI